MSQFTSTMIDDESLIEELKRYGEPNLPSLPSPSSTARRSTRSAASANNELNDTNREIYLKKLNHYRAREKAKLNPSKQFKKQQQSMAQSALGEFNAKQRSQLPSSVTSSSGYDDDDYDQEGDDVIELDNNNGNVDTTTSEYVRVAHAGTSPMSTTLGEDHDTAAGHWNLPDSQPAESKLDYIKLKERIELDKTLSKYRSEIHNILAASNVRNRFHQSTATAVAAVLTPEQEEDAAASRQDDNDIIYTKTVQPRPNGGNIGRRSTASSRPSSTTTTTADDIVTQVHYCPRPAKLSPSATGSSSSSSIFGGIRSRFLSRDSAPTQFNFSQNAEYAAVPDKLEPNARATYLTPKKEGTTGVLGQISNLTVQIAKTLPYIMLVILVVIILQYVRVKFQSETGGTDRPPTGRDSVVVSHHRYCEDVKDPACVGTKQLAREMIDYLRSVSGRVECTPVSSADVASSLEGETAAARRVFLDKCVHVNRLVDYLSVERRLIQPLSGVLQDQAIDSLLGATIRNPQWDVRLLNSTYSDTADINQVTYLMSMTSNKPVMCRIRELAHFIYVRAVLLMSTCVALALVYVGWATWRNARSERERAFYQLVARVTEHVEKQHELARLDNSGALKPYVAISHVYACMFEPRERGPKSARVWQRVCKFIEDHESRIHVEAQFIDGEETLVWKWVATTAPVVSSASSSSSAAARPLRSPLMPAENGIALKTKDAHSPVNANHEEISPSSASAANELGWQGDAFDRSDRLIHSPTPCLKVRNMFDTNAVTMDSYFHVKIHNDILDKCCRDASGRIAQPHANTCILHIACDKRSKEGCVYIKCVSNDAAGKVYQALNGTWYNGKLLNVKFLRSDRYIERFPESANSTTPIQPIHHS